MRQHIGIAMDADRVGEAGAARIVNPHHIAVFVPRFWASAGRDQIVLWRPAAAPDTRQAAE